MIIVYVLVVGLSVGLVLLGSKVRIVKQFERDVVFRLGQVHPGTTRGPGLALIAPFIERIQKVSMRIITTTPAHLRAGTDRGVGPRVAQRTSVSAVP